MVLAQFCHVVEGIPVVKTEFSAFFIEHGGIAGAFHALYRIVIRSDFVRKVAETFATRILLIGIGLISSVIVARILGPEKRGLYAVAGTIGAIGVQLGNLGLHSSNTYYVAKDRTLLPTLVSNTLLFSLIFGSIGTSLTWVVFSIWPHIAPVNGILLTLSLVWIPIGMAYLLLQSLLIGIQEIRTYNKIELFTNTLPIILVTGLIIIKSVTVEAVFSAGFASLAIGFVLLLWRMKSYLSDSLMPSLTLFKRNIVYGLKAYFAALFAFLVLRVDILLVKFLIGAEEAGYYSIATSMANMFYLLPVAIGTILFPTLSAMSSHKEKWIFTKKIAIWIGLLMLVPAGFASMLAEPIIRILFGEPFIPAAPAFAWLIPGIIMLSINTVYMNFFASIGMPMIAVYCPAIAAIINIALNIKLIPVLGITGASLSSVVSYSMMLGGSLVYIAIKKPMEAK
jgi:O-antigen/teichoic acid export membrane protein